MESASLEKITLSLLLPGDRLLLITDGIIEARNRRLELFGFPRLSELAEQDRSAVEIAAAAQNFAQDDDITVLRIERLAGAEQAWQEPHRDSAECSSVASCRADTTLA